MPRDLSLQSNLLCMESAPKQSVVSWHRDGLPVLEAMQNFTGKIAVITGGGDGMGRSLAVQLASEGCHLALCDLGLDSLAETKARCEAAGSGVRITTHECDVSDEAALIRFRDEVAEQHSTDHIHLLFNNAGIGGGGSLVADERSAWERTFNVCWGGVYLGTRTFLPMLMAADESHLVNTSSVNGFWASLGPETPHSSYSAAKFAVKGFSEALVTDLRLTAPNVKVSVVMPGHIGTGIALNSAAAHGIEPDAEMIERGTMFRNLAPMTADTAATVILDGVRAEKWRILVGQDAHELDMAVREAPEEAYDPGFIGRLGGHLAPLVGDG